MLIILSNQRTLENNMASKVLPTFIYPLFLEFDPFA